MTAQAHQDPHTQTQLRVEIDGTELRTELADDLLEVRIDTGVRTIGRAQVRLLDRGTFADGVVELGKAVTISSVSPAQVVFSGTVTSVELEATDRGATVTATVHDQAYDLSRDRAVTTHQKMSDADIIRSTVEGAGLRADVDLPGSSHEWAFRADSRLGLVDEIAGRLGCDWAVLEERFAIWPVSGSAPWARQAPVLDLGVDLLGFTVRHEETGPSTFTVRGWDPEQQGSVTGSATTSTPGDRNGFAPAGSGKKTEVLATRQLSMTDAEATAVAGGLAAAAGRVSGRGRGAFVPGLWPGGLVTIRSAGSADGTYYVREVSHQVDSTSLRTTFVVGDRPPVRLTDPWRVPPSASSLRHTGITVARVDNIDDPDQRGRVRVALEGVSDSASSSWARVLSLGAGPDRGLVVLPEVGDEVLLAFEDGDVRRPVVLGGLFGKQSTVPKPALGPNSSEVTTRHFVSREGHRIEIADGKADAEQYVRMALAGDRSYVRIGKDKTEIYAAEKPLVITSGEGSAAASLTFDGRGNLTINATSITMKAKQSLTLEGMDVEAKASTTFEASAKTRAVVTGTSTVIKGSASTEVSGAVVKIN
ncbi:phage baseplate assembly protein V [Ruania rhizosphaerae]|uniref:phage baseplate assembly protein V n=1 Tax=Ruania rhizosphaerae TaxID=1840413 RepID=UPI00135C654F|nr:phage baseplate assembly protein V [Ruania rhizosphaerae]